ncbi:MAG: hypothetical protein ACXU95_04840 [Isosphaeraceae bacterium]
MELANRMDIEADFAKRLARQSGVHRKALWELIDLLNPQEIPDEFWQQVEEEKRKTMLAQLALIYLLSADQHAAALLPGDLRPMASETMQVAGHEWATQKAATVASQYVQNSKAKLQSAYERWYGPDFQTPANPFASPFGQPQARVTGEVKAPVTGQQALDDLLDIFGPVRDAGIAATETTGAATAGTHGAIDASREFGVIVTVTWKVDRAGNVCPICKPLDGKEMSEWEAVLAAIGAPAWAIANIRANGGPWVHKFCRCYLNITREKREQS